MAVPPSDVVPQGFSSIITAKCHSLLLGGGRENRQLHGECVPRRAAGNAMLLLAYAAYAEPWEAGWPLSLLFRVVKDDKLFLGSKASTI